MIDTCAICSEPNENLKHLFLMCSYVGACGRNLNMMATPSEQETFADGFATIINNCRREKVGQVGI